ncbi:MAG: amidohydrolase family protein [Faecousia sp.]
MKVFDAHCHIYPAKIAKKAAAATATFYDNLGETYDGTVQTLFIEGSGIDRFLVQSVATKPEQVGSINEFIAAEVAQFPDRLYGFGALHPESETLTEDIVHLRELGPHGVKLHPDIQRFRLDSKACFALCEQCEGVLPLLLHTGDRRYSFSNPEQLLPLLRRFPKLTVIAAHFGGYSIWDEAARQLAGRFENLWVDCSSSFFAMDDGHAKELIAAYGAERVLFGTDYPMWNPAQELKRFLALRLPQREEENILYNNAARLFGFDAEERARC